MKLLAFILASGSPRRRELLGEAGLRFRVETAKVEELEEEKAQLQELDSPRVRESTHLMVKQWNNIFQVPI